MFPGLGGYVWRLAVTEEAETACPVRDVLSAGRPAHAQILSLTESEVQRQLAFENILSKFQFLTGLSTPSLLSQTDAHFFLNHRSLTMKVSHLFLTGLVAAFGSISYSAASCNCSRCTPTTVDCAKEPITPHSHPDG